jgi:hypothetical protein
MKALFSFITVGSLLTGAALLPLIGAALLAAVFFALFLLGLTAVLGEGKERAVEQRDPSMNATGWRGD